MSNYIRLQTLFEDFLAKHFFQQTPTALYEPVNYILQLGGKRLRPALLLYGHQLFDANVERALPAAYAVEIFHNFSLVHDDIMDAAPLRRGKPTVHHKYNINTGILSGDVMLIYAYEYLLQTQDTFIISDLIKIFNRFAIEVCEGQQMDMDFEQLNDVTISQYLKMIELKTAALIGGALELGARIGGASAQDAAHLAAFGRNAGIAFQLQDDWLDTFGDPTKVGKKPGGDIIQNKKTYLIIKALELADPVLRTELSHYMSTTATDETEKIERVVRILKTLNIPQIVEAAKTDFMQKAYENLAQVQANETIKQELAALADKLANRDF